MLRGAGGVPLLEKVVWFLGLLVSCFLFVSVSCLSVSWILGFLVSKLLGFEVYWFQNVKVCLNCHSMFYGRY